MFCEKCGKQVEKNSDFCNFCGAKIKGEIKTHIKEDSYIENRQSSTLETKGGLDKVVKISIIVGTLIVALSIAYYLVIFLPQKEKTRVEQQKQDQQTEEQKENAEKAEISKKENQNKLLLSACLADADDNYWNYMELNGTGKRTDKNGVNAYQRYWDAAEKIKKEETDTCFKKYPQ